MTRSSSQALLCCSAASPIHTLLYNTKPPPHQSKRTSGRTVPRPDGGAVVGVGSVAAVGAEQFLPSADRIRYPLSPRSHTHHPLLRSAHRTAPHTQSIGVL